MLLIFLFVEMFVDDERNEVGEGLDFVKENFNVFFEFEELNLKLKLIWVKYRMKIWFYDW